MITGGWVCALNVRTGGLGGAALGSDEEEIVYLAYAIIDVLSNQVIGEREYAVRPTRRPGEELQTGQPLDIVIEQFDEFVRSLQVDPLSPLFRLVTDGQPPLRQTLHPEACSKELVLPTYYSRFHDIRKEFVRAYTLRAVTPRPNQPAPPAPDHPTSIADMLNYLGITPYTGENFYVAEVKDMASIIRRIISDGFRLELPETIDLVLETGICSKDDEIDGNCIVRARGLPWQSSDQDIAKFFRGLNVAKGGVALCLSPQGRRNGEALVRFVSQEHRDMALKRHKHHIGLRYIEVYRASGEDFLSVAGGATCEAAAFLSRGAKVIVRMRGLPYDATPQQVLDFFSAGDDPVQVLDEAEGVLFVRRADGRATGDAFVLFASEEDSPKALSRHRKLIGTRYIELFRSTTAEVQQVLNRSLETRTPSTSSTPAAAAAPTEGILPMTLIPQHVITSGTAKDCVRLRGLPYEAQVDNILTFLDEFAKNIVVQGVHMVYNAQGHPSGEAFIQMDSEGSAYLCAQQKHHRYMTFGKKQRYIEVFQCSGDDMNLVLTGGVTPATSPKVLSPGTLVSPPPPLAPAPRLLAQQIAHQNLLARQHENLFLASLRPPMVPLLPYSFRSPSPAAPAGYPLPILQQPTPMLSTKRTYDRAFAQTNDGTAPKRQYAPQPQLAPALSLPMLSYASSNPIFSYANTTPMLTSYANTIQAGLPTGLPAGYGSTLTATLPPTLTSPFPGLSMFPTYPYYPGGFN